MSRRTLLALAVLGTVVVVPAALRAVEKSSDDRKRVEYTNKEGKYKAILPGRPMEKEFVAAGMKFNMTVVMTSASTTYAIAWLDVPGIKHASEDELQKRLDGGREGALRFSGCSLLREEKIRMEKKYPGRDIVGELPGAIGKMRARMYVVDGRLYQLIVVGPKDFIDSPDAQAFMGSFWLTK